MKRFWATVECDVRLQIRNGFYYATAFVLLFWVGLLSQLPVGNLGWLLPPLVVGNLLITTFYFVGGLVLLERDEGSLEARVATPLRFGEYLGAKVLSLTALALVENLLIVALFRGATFAPLALIAGITMAAVLLVLAGFACVVRYTSINEFLMPSIVYTSLACVPLLTYLGGWEHWLVYLHPLQAPLLLIQAAFAPASPWQLGYGLAYSIVWAGLLYRWSLHAYHHTIVAGAR